MSAADISAARICIYISTNVHTHVCSHVYIHVRIHVRTHVSMCVRVFACMRVYPYAQTYLHASLHTCQRARLSKHGCRVEQNLLRHVVIAAACTDAYTCARMPSRLKYPCACSCACVYTWSACIPTKLFAHMSMHISTRMSIYMSTCVCTHMSTHVRSSLHGCRGEPRPCCTLL